MPRTLTTNVWISNDRRYDAGTSELDMDPADVAVFDDRDVWSADDEDLVAHDLPPVPEPVVSASDDTPTASPNGDLEVLDRQALLAIVEAEGVTADKRWGAKRLRQAIEAHRAAVDG